MEADLIKRWRDHGLSVNLWYNKLIADPQVTRDDKIIAWFREYKPTDLSQYHINHDMGKPFCRTIDENGKEHYPCHSEMSYQKYCEAFGHDIFADMILHDMDFHTKRGEDIAEIWKLPYSDHLYATAWAEIHANAELFGGMDSDSFKIKRKRLIGALKWRN